MAEKIELEDRPEALEKHNKVPKGWLLFFILLILWGIWYIFTYTPQISGWSYYKLLEEEVKETQKVKVAKTPTTNPYKNNKQAIEEGKNLYMQNCAVCHSENLKGGVGPDLTGKLKYGDSDSKMFQIVSSGTQAGMPPFDKQLGADRIWKVLAYINTVRGSEKSS